MIALRPLPTAYLAMLVNLHESCGSAELDIHNRLVVGPTRHPIPGDTGAWIRIISHGFVAGEGGKMIITELGRAAVEKELAGRVKEARF